MSGHTNTLTPTLSSADQAILQRLQQQSDHLQRMIADGEIRQHRYREEAEIFADAIARVEREGVGDASGMLSALMDDHRPSLFGYVPHDERMTKLRQRLGVKSRDEIARDELAGRVRLNIAIGLGRDHLGPKRT